MQFTDELFVQPVYDKDYYTNKNITMYKLNYFPQTKNYKIH